MKYSKGQNKSFKLQGKGYPYYPWRTWKSQTNYWKQISEEEIQNLAMLIGIPKIQIWLKKFGKKGNRISIFIDVNIDIEKQKDFIKLLQEVY